MNVSWRIVSLAALLLVPVDPAHATDVPWHMAQERYVMASECSSMTLQELGSGGVTLLSHVPATKEYCDEAAKWGIKICPYISLYKVAVSGDDVPWESPSRAYPDHLSLEPFWKELDATKHPEWYLRREDGEIRRPFDNPKYQTCFQQSCCNHRDLIAAYQQGVRNIMDLGAGGIFVDNVAPSRECFGAKLGLHDHDWPDKNNNECYKLALRGIYDAVKSYGKQRVVILNPGGPAGDYASCGDCVMWESFVWRSPFDGNTAPMVASRRWDPRSWDKLQSALPRWRPLGERGPSIAPLTYLPDPSSEAENAFFAYAMARLAGFDQWSATCQQRRDILRRLYRVQTGPPTSEPVASGDVVYRHFQNALIVCNFSAQTVEARVSVPPDLPTDLVELFEIREQPIVPTQDTADRQILLSLPPESGRVVVPRAIALDNLLREVEGQALAARLHLEKKEANPNESTTATMTKQLQDIEAQAASLRKTVSEAFPTNSERDTLAAVCKDAAAIPPLSQNDSFLTERLDNLRRHADLLAGLVAK